MQGVKKVVMDPILAKLTKSYGHVALKFNSLKLYEILALEGEKYLGVQQNRFGRPLLACGDRRPLSIEGDGWIGMKETGTSRMTWRGSEVHKGPEKNGKGWAMVLPRSFSVTKSDTSRGHHFLFTSSLKEDTERGHLREVIYAINRYGS